MQNISTLNPPISIRYHLTLNSKVFWLISASLIIGLFIFYILQVNLLTKEIYLIQNSQAKIEDLTQGNETLKIDFSKSNSLSGLESYLKNQNFEKANQIKYIQILETQVVTK